MSPVKTFLDQHFKAFDRIAPSPYASWVSVGHPPFGNQCRLVRLCDRGPFRVIELGHLAANGWGRGKLLGPSLH